MGQGELTVYPLQLFTNSEKPVSPTWVIPGHPRAPTSEDFIVLKSNETVQDLLSASLANEGESFILKVNTNGYRVSAGRYKADATFETNCEQDVLKLEQVLGCRLWNGEVAFAPISFRIQPPWTWQDVLVDLSVAAVVLAATAIGCEWLIRRREARNPKSEIQNSK